MQRTKLVLKKTLGVLLLILGLLALVTPLTPGAWLGIVGLELLGWRVVLQDKICARWPKHAERIKKIFGGS
ncbi:MAG TPA: hypothetical protein VJZ94_00890 [Candidatus Paceibacterota bacterium]|nr:hypothetical protein [Candidatus Paceibacterota bacterium]